VPDVVPRLVDVPRGAELMLEAPAVNPEQLAAIEEAGVVFVSAGAGTGKTTVLVERYVRAVLERGISIDAILVITYTERAAGELKERIRKRLREAGRRELAREIDRAWISTIHGFCSRVLRVHAFDAGLDPRFRVLDESQARVLALESFREALAEFCADRRPERLRLLASYGSRALQTMLVGVFERLRSAGRPLELAVTAQVPLAERVSALHVALAAAGEPADSDAAAYVERVRSLLEADASPERLRELPDAPRDADDAVAAVGETVEAVRGAALEEVAARDRALLEQLLEGFASAYQAAKDRESAVDFEDLQLIARDLLRGNEAVRDRVRLRFRAIMVDEFQDTNRLQCELIDVLGGDTSSGLPAPDLFFVGDEFQSIYRFRHADVAVFRERRERSGGVLALTRNYRSRPEVLAVVNHLFSSEFGEDFEPLQPGGRFPDPLFGPAVELLVTDKASYKGRMPWREAEARHVARRVRALVDAGLCTPGDVVLLFAAGTNAELYEQALRAEGLPTYRASGRGYFGQQQVADLLGYLRLLHNRYDDEAVATVLASPLVGVSNDALVLLRRAAGKRPLFTGLERDPPPGVSPRDRRLFEAFRQRYDRLTRLSASAGLERLCERIVAEHDYDLAVLARWDGRRRYANLRKLARLARSYEELRGPDIEGFVRFVRDQIDAGAREHEAVAEEEGAEAVRLMTIHSAKGLEFKVVVVCDAGRTGPATQPDEILCLPDGRFGFRVADPVTGKRVGVLGYDEVREAERLAADEEARRLYYVAMTRAVDRLIVSGSLDPTRAESARSPIGWVAERLGTDLGGDVQLELDCGGVPVLLRVDRATPETTPARPAGPEQLPLFSLPESVPQTPLFELEPLPAVPEPPPFRIRRLSYSALALYERCSYRFFAERIAGLSPVDVARRADVEEGVGSLVATEVGDAVHTMLEAGAQAAESSRFVTERYPLATPADVERVEALVAAWQRSPLASRIAELRDVRAEQPFAFEQDGVLLHGRFDLYNRADGGALVVDYKTNRLESLAPDDVVESDYRLQRELYALAALRGGADEVEVAFVFLERPDEPVIARFGAADEPELARRLSDAIARIHSGTFTPAPSEMACAGCPALDRVCAGPRLLRGDQDDGEPVAMAEPAV
jgi:ATP-dependent exoDNAse (exonuclease V) beta subunit